MAGGSINVLKRARNARVFFDIFSGSFRGCPKPRLVISQHIVIKMIKKIILCHDARAAVVLEPSAHKNNPPEGACGALCLPAEQTAGARTARGHRAAFPVRAARHDSRRLRAVRIEAQSVFFTTPSSKRHARAKEERFRRGRPAWNRIRRREAQKIFFAFRAFFAVNRPIVRPANHFPRIFPS
ncbi:MAG: hypothetical protein LBC18_07420 [Opitutaceae bacterium]|nr:hypothetical protein [Opitutaceae bacterium]